jgi:NitT/TauT family transport system permease protein
MTLGGTRSGAGARVVTNSRDGALPSRGQRPLRSRRRKVTIIRLIVLLGAALVLEAACRWRIIPATTLIPPSEMLWSLAQLLGTWELWRHMLRTFSNVLIACAAAIVSGVAFGFILHAMPRVRATLEPVFSSYYAVPIFAFYPLFVVLFGLNDIPIILVGYLGAVVVMIVNTLVGLDRVPPVLIKFGRTCRMRPLSLVLTIRLPSAAPALFTGVKLAVAYSFTGVIASEFLLSDSGLGFSVSFAYNSFKTHEMYGLMLLVVILATLVTMMFYVWEQRLAARRKR